jgi:hypothetical protein
VQDLHPHDRGPRGAHHGAIIANGNLYCPQTPRTLLELAHLAPGVAPQTVTVHDQQTAELARHKLGRHTGEDADGYHRATCPPPPARIARRGAGARNIAKTAAARVLLTQVFYSMRDGHIHRVISQAA